VSYNGKILDLTCVLCGKKDEGGAIMLCKEHWDEYEGKARGNFKEFQEFKRTLEEKFKNTPFVD